MPSLLPLMELMQGPPSPPLHARTGQVQPPAPGASGLPRTTWKRWRGRRREDLEVKGGGGRNWRGRSRTLGGEEEDLEGEEEDLPLPLIDGEGVKTMKRRFSFLALVEGSSQRGSGLGGGGPPNTPFHYFCQNEGQSVWQIPFIQICEQ